MDARSLGNTRRIRTCLDGKHNRRPLAVFRGFVCPLHRRSVEGNDQINILSDVLLEKCRELGGVAFGIAEQECGSLAINKSGSVERFNGPHTSGISGGLRDELYEANNG